MKITIEKGEFHKALSLTQSIVERRTTMPILTNILLAAADKHITLAATDLEITAQVRVPAQVSASGSTTVNAKVIADIVRELPDGPIQLQITDGERLEITNGQSRFKMIGVSADEFPSLPGLSIKPKTKIPAKQLYEMISKTLYAVSHDETRFNLNGVCFELVQEGKGKSATKQLRLVATDGHRLAFISRHVGDLQFEGSAIVPTKGLQELRRVLDQEGDNDIGVELSDGFLVVEASQAKISMRLIAGDFPDYNQVLPKKIAGVTSIACSTLSQALRRAALMVTDKGKGVRLDFTKGKLKLSSSSPELGESTEELEIEYSGPETTIGFNARYLLEFAASMEEDKAIRFELSGELGPAKLLIDGDDSYFGIVMPMRLG